MERDRRRTGLKKVRAVAACGALLLLISGCASVEVAKPPVDEPLPHWWNTYAKPVELPIDGDWRSVKYPSIVYRIKNGVMYIPSLRRDIPDMFDIARTAPGRYSSKFIMNDRTIGKILHRLEISGPDTMEVWIGGTLSGSYTNVALRDKKLFMSDVPQPLTAEDLKKRDKKLEYSATMNQEIDRVLKNNNQGQVSQPASSATSSAASSAPPAADTTGTAWIDPGLYNGKFRASVLGYFPIDPRTWARKKDLSDGTPPYLPTTPQPCMRDHYAYSAQRMAWAALSYWNQREFTEADKAATAMQDNIDKALALCSNAKTFGPKTECVTLRFLPCPP